MLYIHALHTCGYPEKTINNVKTQMLNKRKIGDESNMQDEQYRGYVCIPC